MIPAAVALVLALLAAACIYARRVDTRVQAAFSEGVDYGKAEAEREHGLRANRDARWSRD